METPEATFVKQVETHQTGGWVMVDTVLLKNGKVLAVSEDCVTVYPSMAAWEENDYEMASKPVNFEDVHGREEATA